MYIPFSKIVDFQRRESIGNPEEIQYKKNIAFFKMIFTYFNNLRSMVDIETCNFALPIPPVIIINIVGYIRIIKKFEYGLWYVNLCKVSQNCAIVVESGLGIKGIPGGPGQVKHNFAS